MTFYVYLDECGNEGFTFSPPPKKRGCEWFTLSAVVVDRADYPSVKAQYTGYKRRHKKQANWHFHFVKASHDDRLGFLDWMSRSPIACMSVLIHKPSITRVDAFSLPYRMYFYAARILLERASWYCIKQSELGQGTSSPDAQIVFSQRRGLTQESVRNYVRLLAHRVNAWLEIDPSLVTNTIDWRVISPEQIWVQPRNLALVGLQLADALAGSIGRAIELNEYGLTENRYVKMLTPVIYKSAGTYRSYGLKFFPKPPNEIFAEPRFHWLHRFR